MLITETKCEESTGVVLGELTKVKGKYGLKSAIRVIKARRRKNREQSMAESPKSLARALLGFFLVLLMPLFCSTLPQAFI